VELIWRTELSHHFRVLGMTIAAAAAVTTAVIAAPQAAASTTASCPTGGIITVDVNLIPSPATVHLTSGCPGFVDTGAPYVFDIAKLTVDPIDVDPTPLGRPRTYDNVVETCTSVSTGSAGLVAMNCTHTT